MLVVYKIENNDDGRVYIGQTNSLQRRMIQHRCEQRRYVDKSINKYGIESFTVSVIDEVKTRDELNEKEKYWIQFYDCRFPKGYNFTDGGDGSPGHKMSESQKNKLRESRIGYQCSEETRQKMRMAKLGKALPEEQKRKLRESLIGRPVSEETREKIRKANTGKHPTEEQRQKMSIANMGEKHHFFGKHFSEEHKRKLSESNIGKHVMSEETKLKMSEAHTGFHHTDEAKKKIGEASKARYAGSRIDKRQPLLQAVNA